MTIPESLYPLFHRYDPRHLDVDRNASLVIETILQLGRWNDIEWCFQTYGWDRIRSWIASPHANGVLAPAAEWFWTLVLLGTPRTPSSLGSGNHLRATPVPPWWPDDFDP
jgi:hypothetical protein